MSGAGNRSSAVAAALIILAVALGFVFMPSAMLWLGEISPWLAMVFGALFVLAFFAVFWLRARYQRRRGAVDEK